MEHNVLLVGAGPMAIDYAKVLNELSVQYTVVGRSDAGAAAFEAATGKKAATGGLEAWLKCNDIRHFSEVIISVGERQLGREVLRVIDAGCRKVLVEKPGAFDYAELKAVATLASKHNVACFVGYNRRFYSSVKKAKELIEADGGVTSFQFEFTEWSHKICGLKKEEGVLDHWYFHNSTHVIDMAFFLGGWPKEISCYTAGSLPWHTTGSRFYGAGRTSSGALFSYSSNWEAPGRWGVEVSTLKHRFIFRPLESLQVMSIGSVAINAVDIEISDDQKYKPGLFLQTKSFLNDSISNLCDLQSQLRAIEIYRLIESGGTL